MIDPEKSCCMVEVQTINENVLGNHRAPNF